MSDAQQVADEFNLLADEVPQNNFGSIFIEVEDQGSDDEEEKIAISFGHQNLSRVEVINLLSYVYDQYVSNLGICTCGECDEDDE